MDVNVIEEKVKVLQAHVRGYLVRKHFQSLTEEYAGVVTDIEGNCDSLCWRGAFIPIPSFYKTKETKRKVINDTKKVIEGLRHEEVPVEEHIPFNKKAEKNVQADAKVKPLDNASELQAAVPEPSDRGEAAAEPYKLSLPEKDGTVESSSRSFPGSESSFREERDIANSSSVTSVWNSTVMDSTQSLIPKGLAGHELPETLEGLRQHRSDLAMELLWLQQAITSRKNYLTLKQNLGT
ncbi:IQ domain-containing protein C [Protopterus annectens]|uniref:IQ domain-containing protein C n=1 Tax=Protopterus annectens TaxID=7888 RepID=UPI001CFAF256|nr:IQ domain-containing protein C [Protopterus annectens]